MSIPKKIHYCWFGRGQMPRLAIKCINSWKKYMPDYELVLWNEDNFDIDNNQFAKEAYEAKKYAFVSDYVRVYVLYKCGGIYMDTDVEVLKPLDEFLNKKAFIGCETESFCGTGTIGAEREHLWILEILNYYKEKRFVLKNGKYNLKPNPEIITEIMIENYEWIPRNEHQIIREGVNVYPTEVFCAKDLKTGKIFANINTYTIHHFSGSWFTKREKIKREVIKLMGTKMTAFLVEVKKKLK